MSLALHLRSLPNQNKVPKNLTLEIKSQELLKNVKKKKKKFFTHHLSNNRCLQEYLQEYLQGIYKKRCVEDVWCAPLRVEGLSIISIIFGPVDATSAHT